MYTMCCIKKSKKPELPKQNFKSAPFSYIKKKTPYSEQIREHLTCCKFLENFTLDLCFALRTNPKICSINFYFVIKFL